MQTSYSTPLCRHCPNSIDRWRESFDSRVLRRYRRRPDAASVRTRSWAPPSQPVWVASVDADEGGQPLVSVAPGSWSTCGRPPPGAAWDDRAARAASADAVVRARSESPSPRVPARCRRSVNVSDAVASEALTWAVNKARAPSALPPDVDSVPSRGHFSVSRARSAPVQHASPAPVVDRRRKEDRPPPPPPDHGKSSFVAAQAAAHVAFSEHLRAAATAMQRVTADREMRERKGTCERLRRMRHAQSAMRGRLQAVLADVAGELHALEQSAEVLEELRRRKDPLLAACEERRRLRLRSCIDDADAAEEDARVLAAAAASVADMHTAVTNLHRQLTAERGKVAECAARAAEAQRIDEEALRSGGVWSQVSRPQHADDQDCSPPMAARDVIRDSEGLVVKCVAFRRQLKRQCLEIESAVKQRSERTQTALRHRRSQRGALIESLRARAESLRDERERTARQADVVQHGMEGKDRERAAVREQLRLRRLRPFAGCSHDSVGESMELQQDALADAVEQYAVRLNTAVLETGRLEETLEAVEAELAAHVQASAADEACLTLPFAHSDFAAARSLCEALCGGHAAVYGAHPRRSRSVSPNARPPP